jgi:hypothetical protein
VVCQTLLFSEAGTFLGVDVDVLGVGTEGYFGPVCVEGEGDDGAGKQLVDLRSRHFEGGTGQEGSQPFSQGTETGSSAFSEGCTGRKGVRCADH